MSTTIRQFLVDHLETIAFHTSVAVAVAGAIALLLVWWRWSWLGKRYREFWAKCAVAVFRAIAAASAILAKSAPNGPGRPLLNQPWMSTVLTAIAGYYLGRKVAH